MDPQLPPVGSFASSSGGSPGPAPTVLPRIAIGAGARAQSHPDGSWQSPGYRSARIRARWVKGGFVFAVIACGLAAIALFNLWSLLNGTTDVSQVDTAFVARQSDGAAAWLGMAVIVLAIAFPAWLSRTVDNTPPLGGGTSHDSPRYAIGWWFVPIASFWKPYTVVREAADRLAFAGRDYGRFVIWWWVLFAAGFTLNRFAVFGANSATTPADLGEAFLVNSIAMACLIADAILGFVVVQGIQGNANARAAALGLEAPDARWPTAETAAAAQAREALLVASAPRTASYPTAPTAPTAFGPATPAPAPAYAAAPVAGAVSSSASPTLPGDAAAFCPSCGRKRADGAAFCTGCGHRFDG